MRLHRHSPEPTSTRRSATRGRLAGLGSLPLSVAAVVALAGFCVLDEPEDRSGGPRFRTTEQPATAVGALVALP